MRQTRWTLLGSGMIFVLLATVAISEAQKGKKPPPEPEPDYRLQMQIDDGHSQGFGYGVSSDARGRLWDVNGAEGKPDADEDGYVDFDGLAVGQLIPHPSAVYRDRFLPHAEPPDPGLPDPAPLSHPDPCVGTSVSGDESLTVVDLDRGDPDTSWKNCIESVPGHADDGRTVVLTFNKAETGGRCVCDQFRFLALAPAAWGEASYRTGFSETGDAVSGTCTVTPYADGRLLTNWTQAKSANVRVESNVFERIKHKGSTVDREEANLRIGFFVDQTDPLDPDEGTRYEIRSVDDLDVSGSGDLRTVTATNSHIFELNGPNNTGPPAPGCSGFTLPARVTFERVDLNASSQ